MAGSGAPASCTDRPVALGQERVRSFKVVVVQSATAAGIRRPGPTFRRCPSMSNRDGSDEALVPERRGDREFGKESGRATDLDGTRECQWGDGLPEQGGAGAGRATPGEVKGESVILAWS